MEEKNLIEKLAELSPGMEVWWDSSPVIFDNWCKKVLAKVSAQDAPVMKRHLDRMYDPNNLETQLFRGVTTNPPISLQAIQDDVPYWEKLAQDLIQKHNGIDKEGLFWLLYQAVVKRGSDMYMPLYEQSGYKEGFLSSQVDPRNSFDKEAMLKEALSLAKINPNIMIKVPGTKEGLEVIEILTAKGISTNNTLSFIFPQVVDCAKTVKRGLETARKNNVELSRWRSIITLMESRFGDLGGLRDFAREKGLELSDAEVRWAELAIFKKSYKYLKHNDMPSKLLSCSLRFGPIINGQTRLWHLEEKTGADIVITVPPSFIEQVINFPEQKNIVYQPNRILEDIPNDVLKKLLKIPYFERSYLEDGYTRDEYNTHPALVRTAEQFSKATTEMVEFAGNCLEKAGSA